MGQALPNDAFQKAEGRLFVSMTNATSLSKIPNVMTSTYLSNEDLIKCLMASCYIPGYAKSDAPLFDQNYDAAESPNTDKNNNRKFHKQKGKMIDGGFTDNLPLFHDIPTISVSPFSGKMDICPQDGSSSPRLSIAVKKLPIHLSYYNLGFTDCVRYLKRTNEYYES